MCQHKRVSTSSINRGLTDEKPGSFPEFLRGYASRTGAKKRARGKSPWPAFLLLCKIAANLQLPALDFSQSFFTSSYHLAW